VRILMWDVHGGYTDSLVAGTHEYLFLPRDASGHGGLARYGGSPPSNAYEVSVAELRDRPPDLVLLQRLEEIELCVAHLGLRPGRELPAVFLEHNTPKTDVPSTQHPLADEPGLLIVHVTEASRAVPAVAGARSADITELVTATRALLADPDEARRRGLIARRAALDRYGLRVSSMSGISRLKKWRKYQFAFRKLLGANLAFAAGGFHRAR
jgi:hypothetical protein